MQLGGGHARLALTLTPALTLTLIPTLTLTPTPTLTSASSRPSLGLGLGLGLGLEAFVCFLQAFVARLLMVGLLLVLLLALCGLAIEDAAPRFPSWTLFAAAGTVLATLLGWVLLSVASVVPSRLGLALT